MRRPRGSARLAALVFTACTALTVALAAPANSATSQTATSDRAPTKSDGPGGPANPGRGPDGGQPQAADRGKYAPTVRRAVAHDESKPLAKVARAYGDDAKHRARKDTGKDRTVPNPVLPKARKAARAGLSPAQRGSAAVQQRAPEGNMPDYQANFDGVENIDGVLPPDTEGDVGEEYYMQWVNLHFAVYDKDSGAAVLGPLPGNALWDGFGGPCETHNDGDPVVQYDALSGRWMASQFAIFADDGNHQCIAVSQTGDPTGAWYRYDFFIDDEVFNDYPKFGVWPDAYYMSFNAFSGEPDDEAPDGKREAEQGFEGAGAVAFEREAMLSGQPAQMVYFNVGDVNTTYGGQLPSDAEGAAPPEGSPNYFIEADDDASGFDSDRLNVWEFHVDWDDPASSTFGDDLEPNYSVETEPFDSNMCNYARSCVPQPDTSAGLDAIADRVMYRLSYRNFGDHESMVVNHTVDVDGNDRAGTRWYELRKSGGDDWAMHQQGTFAPDEENRWMASIGQDASGNIAMGYSVSSEDTYPSIRAAGRLDGDPLGELTRGESEMIAGTGSQTSAFSRWGDYSSITIDPTDNCTFWYTTEYLANTSSADWRTRVGSFKFPSCTQGPTGQITGAVTDDATGDPIEDATVQADEISTTTDEDGEYTLTLSPGTYDVTASAFGYETQTADDVEVTDGGTAVQDFALTPKPTVSVSGLVRDGSGHGWPLYAKVSIQGVPGVSDFTAPRSGRYRVELPAQTTYTFVVESQYEGYETLTEDVEVSGRDMVHDFGLTVTQACTAPGYEVAYDGLSQDFDAGSLPPGWRNTDEIGNGQNWQFDDPGNRGNLTGGEDGFAIIDSDEYGPDGEQNSSLVSPSFDLSGSDSPVVGFSTDFNNLTDDTADVDLSIDGGDSWSTIWHQTEDRRGPARVEIPAPEAADQSDVKVRFHYYNGDYDWWWEVDDAFVGNRSCEKVRGGLLIGNVRDRNTRDPINGATVTSVDRPAEHATTEPTADDPQLADGFYSMFSSLTGRHPFTAESGSYKTQTKHKRVRVDYTKRMNFALAAGQLDVSPSDLESQVRLGRSKTTNLTISNNGSAAAEVKLGERDGGFVILSPDGTKRSGEQIASADGTPVRKIHGTFSPYASQQDSKRRMRSREAAPAPLAPPWTDVADYPTTIMDNSGGFLDGKSYSFGGTPDGLGPVADSYVYDPQSQQWSEIADMPEARQKTAGAFIGGKFYAAAGWGESGDPSAETLVYDPGSDSWSTAADSPAPRAASGTAVLDGKLYAVGGCPGGSSCGATDVTRYDPGSDSWDVLADYPESTSWLACGGIAGEVYCTGGTNASNVASTSTYAYDPGADSWTQKADLPIDLWAMGYVAANGKLLVSGGVTDQGFSVTNQGFAYDPAEDSWSELPNSNNALYRGGSSCGFYKSGGSSGGFSATPMVEQLPGFDQCGAGTDVPWLSEEPTEATLQPGESVDVAVTMDSGVVTQPGTYTAQLLVKEDTPYSVDPVDVTMNVRPPRTWGKLLGTVIGTTCAGDSSPLSGATVQIDSWANRFTLSTDADGGYALWLDRRNNPLQMIVALDGWQPEFRRTRVHPGESTTEDFALEKAGC